MELTIERWAKASPDERTRLGVALAKKLPLGFIFKGVQLFQLNGFQNHVALYTFKEANFALIPGGSVGVGYDANRTWEPNPDELESWDASAEEYGIEQSLHDYIASVTLRLREVEIPPMLMETVAVGMIGATPALANGFRLPTSNEWEYACAAGSSTLFRWGDHVPCDRYPIDKAPAGGGEWKLHLEPNAFGICGSADPYKYEAVAENPLLLRGGDGGGAICGGSGFFLGWLPLASAYFDENDQRDSSNEFVLKGFLNCRRVLDLH